MSRREALPYPSIFGQVIKAHREWNNLSQKELHHLSRVPPRKLAAVESGHLDYIGEDWWDALLVALPSLSRQQLYLAKMVDPRNNPPPVAHLSSLYQEIVVLFHNWVLTRDIHLDGEAEALLSFLRQRTPNKVDNLAPSVPLLLLPSPSAGGERSQSTVCASERQAPVAAEREAGSPVTTEGTTGQDEGA